MILVDYIELLLTPFITQQPKVDATDFYLFRSYESNREGYITLIANFVLVIPYQIIIRVLPYRLMVKILQFP